MKTCFFLLILLFFLDNTYGQEKVHTQTIRGKVVDIQTQSTLEGANIIISNIQPTKGTISDKNGEFKIEDIPTGRYNLVVTYIGYHPTQIKNIILNSTRQEVLFVELEQKVETTEEITVVGESHNLGTLNSMASVSARVFSVEHTNRYAGSHDDIARMAMNFAGVSGANDQRNDIIIRGNTPSGILWRLDDIDIPNPNHFAATGTTGGPISIFNNNVLRNSEFYTSAFPAEYSNVFSGVFDLNMREGNNEKTEILGQVGFNGVEVGLEGPFSKTGKSSYMVNGRFSFLGFFEKAGFNFGTAGVPKYKDLTYKFSFPVENGKISLFGLGGTSHIGLQDSKLEEPDLYALDGMDIYNGSELWVTGLSYQFYKDSRSYSKAIVSYVYQNPFTNYNKITDDNKIIPRYREENKEMKLSFKLLFNKKYSNHFSGRYGVTFDLLGYELDSREYLESNESWKYLVNKKENFGNGTNLNRFFSQFSYKFNDYFEIKPGLSVLYFGLNKTYNIEPRLGMIWKTSPKTSLNFGFGYHSKIHTLTTYFYQSLFENGVYQLSNSDLDLLKARHYSLGYNWLIGNNLKVVSEIYFQDLYSVPVEVTSSSYSLVNEGAQWGLNTREKLKSTGKADGKIPAIKKREEWRFLSN